MTKIYGFSFLKDGVRFDYPFVEAFTSLAGVAEEIYIALGQNDDGTKAILEKLPTIKIIDTVWDMSRMGQGGLIFSEQTNIALEKLREDHGHEESAWGIYLQSDEVIHENSYEKLREDIKKADAQGCDAISFRYFHFWQSHYSIAINKRWYPVEIRAVKLNSKVLNHGDAQGFSGFSKVYESDVYIHHYGHVRDEEKRQEKQKFLIKSIRASEKFQKYFKREQRAFAETKTLPLLLNHPAVMKDRIERMGESFSKSPSPKVYIVGNKDNFKEETLKKINALEVNWVDKLSLVPKEFKKDAIILEPGLLDKLLSRSKVPDSMESKLARKWDKDTFLLLKLSEKGVSFK
ncbi:MAG: hypothetical protein CME70_00415 [Halobacteriovorax sp.]|nr:hypothetical protein [Halobacteriovorax sp.]|tara:strand:- start:32604 stop:33644 length:1041 start_codon:yes stop_codon:yes gene_type:complete